MDEADYERNAFLYGITSERLAKFDHRKLNPYYVAAIKRIERQTEPTAKRIGWDALRGWLGVSKNGS
jgi:hypothetical protein